MELMNRAEAKLKMQQEGVKCRNMNWSPFNDYVYYSEEHQDFRFHWDRVLDDGELRVIDEPVYSSLTFEEGYYIQE